MDAVAEVGDREALTPAPWELANKCGGAVDAAGAVAASRAKRASQARRREANQLLRKLNELTTLERVSFCRRVPVKREGVTLSMRPDGVAQYSGLATCGSVHCCPRCSSRIWVQRAEELTRALQTWHAQGGQIAMLTLTMRHHRGMRLTDMLGAQAEAWRTISQNRAVRRLREDLGGGDGSPAGYVRVGEQTWSPEFGWHPHFHALLFLAGDATPEGVQALGDAVFDGWSSRLQRAGMPAPLRGQGGLDIKLLDLKQGLEAVAGYHAKGSYETAAAEVAGPAPGKRARRGNLTPWDVLRHAVATGEVWAVELWREYEQATRGRRAVTWSRGLRAELGLLEDEPSDEELAADEHVAAEPIVLIEHEDWAMVWRRPDGPALLLEAAEAAVAMSADPRAAVLDLLGRWSGSPPPPG